MGGKGDGLQRRPNLSPAAQSYLKRLESGVEDLFHHVLAVLHDPAYREANAGALRMEWPRIPLPGWPEGNAPGAAEELTASAVRGRELAQLLDPETPVPGVTTGPLRPELAAIAVPAPTDGGNMADEDFEITAGWGHYGSGDAVMPGQGRVEERSYTAEERASLGDAMATLGDTTFDIYLNGRAYWRNVPANVWSYKLGGYQVLKKWLSYRASKVLGRRLTPEEVQHFTGAADRGGPDADWKVSCSHAVSLEGAPYGGPGSDSPARGGNQPKLRLTIPPATRNRVPQRLRGQCWSRCRHRRLPVRDRLGMVTVAKHTAPMQAAAARMMPPARRAPGYPAMMPVSPAMPPSAATVITAMAPPRMMRSFHWPVIVLLVLLLFGLALWALCRERAPGGPDPRPGSGMPETPLPGC